VQLRLEQRAARADANAWQWLTIRAGLPVISAATQDKFVPQMLNLDVLGGIDFRKGCYTGQEIIARTQYLGRLKERLYAFTAADVSIEPGARLWSPAFGDQPCGTVINNAVSPDGGCDLLAVLQIAAAQDSVHIKGIDGPVLAPRPLPYEIPAASAPRGRLA
jgi:folate-binding protein YgfZ